jgi:hypothetical protein
MQNLPSVTVPQIPRESVDALKEDLKEAARGSVKRVLEGLEDGRLSLEDATEAIDGLVEGAIDAGAKLADDVIEPGPLLEPMTDEVIYGLAAFLKAKISDPLSRAIQAIDDAIGYNPRRALRRLDEALDHDRADGTIGDDKVRLVYRLARRLVRRDPELAAASGLAFRDEQLVIDGTPWGEAPGR